jgi:hypothetical protein
MVFRYVRQAKTRREGFGNPFPDLPAELTGSPKRDTGSPKKGPERDTGSETGINKGRSITRDATFSAGFVNPAPTGSDSARRDATTKWATGGQRRCRARDGTGDAARVFAARVVTSATLA